MNQLIKKGFLISLLILLLGMFYLVIPGFQKKDKIEPRLVLLYAPCTVNKKYLSIYNPSIKYTPNLNNFGKESYIFMKHRTEAGFSGAAYASLFTGNTVINHGVFTHPMKLPDHLYEISESFRKNGYDTVFWGKHPMAGADLNYAQGCNTVFKKKLTADDNYFIEILKRIKKDKNYKVFIMTNFTVTHTPYPVRNLNRFKMKYPDESTILDRLSGEKLDFFKKVFFNNHRMFSYNFQGAVKKFGFTAEDTDNFIEFVDVLYKSSISFLDELFGDIIEELKREEIFQQALVVFTADHGELLSKKGLPFKWTHGFTVSTEVLDIPLLIKPHFPINGEKRINMVTRSIDVFPTISGLSNIFVDNEALEGKDFFNNRDMFTEIIAYSFSSMLPEGYLQKIETDTFKILGEYYPNDKPEHTWVSLRSEDISVQLKKNSMKKFVFELFNLKTDPFECKNIYNKKESDFKVVIQKLLKYKSYLLQAEKIWSKKRSNDKSNISSDESIKKLKSLGYL